MIAPTRYKLTADQLAAGLALAGLTPTARSALPVLPAPADPVTALAGSGMLSADNRLTDTAATTLRVATDPSRIFLVTANRAGQELWAAAILLHRSDNGMFVMQACTEDEGFDFAVLPTLTQATVLVDELLDLTAFGSGSGSTAIELDLYAFAALLAAADVAQNARLNAVMARTIAMRAPELTSAALEEQLAEGLHSNDTRWAVPAAQRAVPVSLAAASSQMDRALRVLASLDLIRVESPNTYEFTERGTELATSLSQIVTTGSLAVLTDAVAGRTALAHLTMFRTPLTTWFAFWTGLGEGDPHAHLFDTTNETALRLIRSLLDTPEPTAAEGMRGRLPNRNNNTSTAWPTCVRTPSRQPRFQ